MMRTSDKALWIEDRSLTSCRPSKLPFKCVSIGVSMNKAASKRGEKRLLRLRPHEIDVSSDVLLKAADRYCRLTKEQ